MSKTIAFDGNDVRVFVNYHIYFFDDIFKYFLLRLTDKSFQSLTEHFDGGNLFKYSMT